MGNKYTTLFNEIIAPHLHALVGTVSECQRVKILIHTWDNEIEKIWPEQTINVTESTSDVIAHLSFWIGGLRDKFEAGLSRKKVIQVLDDVFYVSLRFYFEFGANREVEQLIEKFCKTTDAWLGEKVLMPKLRAFKQKIKKNVSVESSPITGSAPIITITPPPTLAVPPIDITIPPSTPAVPQIDITIQPPVVTPPIVHIRTWIKRAIAGALIAILLLGFAVFLINQTQNADNAVVKTQLVNKTVSTLVSQQISFAEYITNQNKYADGVQIEFRGLLKYGLPSTATSGALVYSIVDDLGNEIALTGLTESQKKLAPRGQTVDVYLVSGTIKRKFGGLKIEVSQITPSERLNTPVSKQITIQENTTELTESNKLNSFTALVVGLFNRPQKNCTDGTQADSCSTNKPYFCTNEKLIESPADCGCPEGQREYQGKCITSVQCSDGTLEPECSTKLPYKCVGGKLVSKANACGCPPNHFEKGDSCIKIQKCTDGTLYGECADKLPLFCDEGTLIETAAACGCPYDQVAQDNRCVSKYEVNPKKIHLEYTLHGRKSAIEYTVYQGLSDYLAGLPRSYYCGIVCPSKTDLELKYLEESNQKPYLEPLVDAIKKQTPNTDDRARIAISIVQSIPYDWEGFRTGELNGKYPYEVLVEQKGVCGEKSKLLAFLLRELGYGVVLFEYPEQNHQAVGIKCPSQYGHSGTGYCFVESTRPSIITDDQHNYVGVGKLTRPEIIPISEGKSFDSVDTEYRDAQRMIQIDRISESTGGFLDSGTYSDWARLVRDYGIQLSK